jgi:large subunit ribosomal protein L29
MAESTMKPSEIREKETEAIKMEIQQNQKKLFDLRNQSVTEKVEDTSQFRKIKRDVARMKTIVFQREMQSKAQAK